MTQSSHRHPQPIRTYAADLEQARQQREQETPETKPVAKAPIKKRETPPTPKHQPAVVAPTKPAPKSVHRDVTPKTNAPEPKVTLPPTHTAHPPIKIPAFHELEKNVKAVQEHIVAEEAKQTSKTAHQSDTHTTSTKAVRANIGYDTTIITDTKSDRFKLFPSIISSVQAWFKRSSAKRKRKKTPTYTVPDADRRKGVIQRATSKTGTIFTADSETLKEQIRRRRQEEEELDDSETIWTPYTEPGYTLLEAPDDLAHAPDVTQNVSVTYKKKPIFIEPTRPVPTVTESVAEVTTEQPTGAMPEPAATFVAESPVPAPLLDDDMAEARWSASHEEEKQLISAADQYQTTDPAVLPVPITLIVDPDEAPTPRPEPVKPLSLRDTNTLTIVLLVSVIGVVAVIFALFVLYEHFIETPTATPAVLAPTESILQNASIVGIPLTMQTLDQIPTLLEAAIASSSAGFVEYAVVSGTGDEVSPSYLFELLQFKTMASLRQSLLSARFVSVNRSEPGIILSFTDTDTVRGGLLSWETTLARDLRVLYEIPVSDIPKFTDDSIAGIDVRVLTQNDEIVLLYGILDETRALIMTDENNFAQIVTQGLGE